MGETRAYIDIIADDIFAAEKEGRKIAVEVKSFVGKSNLSELEKAIGEKIYNTLFLHPDVIELIETEDLKVLVFDETKEVIVRWIN